MSMVFMSFVSLCFNLIGPFATSYCEGRKCQTAAQSENDRNDRRARELSGV